MLLLPLVETRTWAEAVVAIIILLVTFRDKIFQRRQERNLAKKYEDEQAQKLIDSKIAPIEERASNWEQLAGVRLQIIATKDIQLQEQAEETGRLKSENKMLRERLINESQDWFAIKGAMDDLKTRLFESEQKWKKLDCEESH